MQLSVELIEWQEAVARNIASTLHDDLAEINDGVEPSTWVRSPEAWPSDSANQYTAVQVACVDIGKQLEDDSCFRDSIGVIFSSDGLPFELDNPMECWFMAMSPDTIRNVARNFNSVNFNSMAEPFRQHCSSDTPFKLFDQDSDFEDDFFSYLIQWKQAIDESAARNWGLLAHCG